MGENPIRVDGRGGRSQRVPASSRQPDRRQERRQNRGNTESSPHRFHPILAAKRGLQLHALAGGELRHARLDDAACGQPRWQNTRTVSHTKFSPELCQNAERLARRGDQRRRDSCGCRTKDVWSRWPQMPTRASRRARATWDNTAGSG